MPKRPHRANPEMLLLLAWLSTLDLHDQARKDREARPWKYPHRPPWDQSGHPVFPEELVHRQIALALECFKSDPIYGPLFETLVRYRLTYIDFPRVAWAIELESLADPMCALFFSDSSYYSEHQQKTAFIDEADAFRHVVSSHVPLANRLYHLSKTWNGDICRGACALQSFFGWYLELAARPLHVPFFLVELLRISLHKVNWHVIAQQVLKAPHPVQEACRCADRMQEVLVGVTVEYLGEVFKVTGDEAAPLGQQLPEPERTQTLLLADLCRETTKAMRPYRIDNEAR